MHVQFIKLYVLQRDRGECSRMGSAFAHQLELTDDLYMNTSCCMANRCAKIVSFHKASTTVKDVLQVYGSEIRSLDWHRQLLHGICA